MLHDEIRSLHIREEEHIIRTIRICRSGFSTRRTTANRLRGLRNRKTPVASKTILKFAGPDDAVRKSDAFRRFFLATVRARGGSGAFDA